MAQIKFIIIAILVWFIAMVLTFSLVNYSYGHEGHGFKHMEGPSGLLIGQRQCPDGTMVWYHDDNEDNIVDGCTQVILTHDKIHIRHIDMVNGTCECP